jgi:hypothetical protein
MVELLSPLEVKSELKTLKSLLSNISDMVPKGDNLYQFQNFALDPEKVKDFGGEDCAVNHGLKIIFCPQGRRDGPIVLKGQGPGLVAVVDVLEKWIQIYLKSMVLQKWISDLATAAKYVGAVSRL